MHVRIEFSSSQCSSIPPVYHLIQQTDPSQPTKLMILGTACSAASILMGEIAEKRLNITQVCVYYVVIAIFVGKLMHSVE